MQRIFAIFLLTYFTLATLLLPQGDFSTLPDIPRMYAHCRDTEDYDMDAVDFICEHLFQINDLMGEIPDPNDKPHQPVQFHHLYSPVITTARCFYIETKVIDQTEKKDAVTCDEKYLSDYPASVFRPPIG